MADPHGTGEVNRKAVYWGLECEDTNISQPFLYGVPTKCFLCVNPEGALPEPAALLPWKVNAVCVL